MKAVIFNCRLGNVPPSSAKTSFMVISVSLFRSYFVLNVKKMNLWTVPYGYLWRSDIQTLRQQCRLRLLQDQCMPSIWNLVIICDEDIHHK